MTKSEIVRKMALRFGPILAENNKREQEALQGYYALLNDIDGYAYDMAMGPDGKCDPIVLKFWKDYLTELREQIEEIIADELNHAATLHELMIKFGQVKEARE